MLAHLFRNVAVCVCSHSALGCLPRIVCFPRSEGSEPGRSFSRSITSAISPSPIRYCISNSRPDDTRRHGLRLCRHLARTPILPPVLEPAQVQIHHYVCSERGRKCWGWFGSCHCWGALLNDCGRRIPAAEASRQAQELKRQAMEVACGTTRVASDWKFAAVHERRSCC
jgi:hypothetical protein